jgi:hypothetical protein
MTRKTSIVAEICLYGTSTIGAGWLAQTADGKMFGDGEPVAGRNFTHAVWLAVEALQDNHVTRGMVRIFAAGGQMMAVVDINKLGYYGDLKWQPAIQYVVEVA